MIPEELCDAAVVICEDRTRRAPVQRVWITIDNIFWHCRSIERPWRRSLSTEYDSLLKCALTDGDRLVVPFHRVDASAG
jgi:hypothetical protein